MSNTYDLSIYGPSNEGDYRVGGLGYVYVTLSPDVTSTRACGIGEEPEAKYE